MAGDYLKRSRHGSVLYFRRRVPDDLRACVGKPYLTKTLGTSVRRDAIVLAREYAVTTDILFAHIRNMTKKKSASDPVTIYYDLSAVFDGVELTFTNVKPDDQPAIDEHLRNAAKTFQVRSGAVEIKSSVAPPVVPVGGKTIKEVWEMYKAAQIAKGAQDDMRGGWRDEGRADVDHWPHVRDFIDHVGGDKPIAEVTEDDVIDFHLWVMNNSSIRSANSKKKKLVRAGALFRFAKSRRRMIKDDFSDLFRFDGKIKKNPYQKFDHDDLVALFESDAYRTGSFETTSEYWLPLLGLFTGARLNELCQLRKSDIGKHENIDTVLILDDEENKRLKTDASRRIVPIHSKLIELGFLDFVKALPDGRIFPHLREDPLKPGDFGQKASEDFRDYRRLVGVGNLEGEGKSRKVFHSFRSTFIDAMRRAEVPKDRRTRLAGHDYDDTHDDTYNGGDPLTMFAIATLKNDVESVKFDVRFTPYRVG